MSMNVFLLFETRTAFEIVFFFTETKIENEKKKIVCTVNAFRLSLRLSVSLPLPC